MQTVVGISETSAASLIAEIGTDMTRFASDKHIAGFRWGLSGEQKDAGGNGGVGKTRHQATST